MGQILRHHQGQLALAPGILEDLENTLAVTDGPTREELAPIMERAAALRAAGQDPHEDPDLNRARLALEGHWALNLADLYSLHQLRRTATISGEHVLVEAAWLSDVRNALDSLLINWDASCRDLLEELTSERDTSGMRTAVAAAVAAGTPCAHCEHCQFCRLRDRLDAALDSAGFYGGAYYQAYVRAAA